MAESQTGKFFEDSKRGDFFPKDSNQWNVEASGHPGSSVPKADVHQDRNFLWQQGYGLGLAV